MNDLYPWLEPARRALAGQIEAHRLPHALLITGRPGLGMLELAEHLAGMLLCNAPTADRQPCGQCPACTRLAAGTHPDFLQVTPDEDATAIKVDQVRALSEALSLCAHGQGFKVAIVSPADMLNINAANSLLKTLEEPSDNTVLVLVSDRPARLPATIRSRCQRVRITVPARAEALDWLSGQLPDATQAETSLQLAGGAPLAALTLAGEGRLEVRRERLAELVDILDGRATALAVAQSWCRDEDMQGLHWLREWLMDMLRIRMTGETGSARSIDLAETLAGLARRLDNRSMFSQLDLINRVLGAGTGSLNRQLMTEDILLAWAAQH